jgi:hypothetical protein
MAPVSSLDFGSRLALAERWFVRRTSRIVERTQSSQPLGGPSSSIPRDVDGALAVLNTRSSAPPTSPNVPTVALASVLGVVVAIASCRHPFFLGPSSVLVISFFRHSVCDLEMVETSREGSLRL